MKKTQDLGTHVSDLITVEKQIEESLSNQLAMDAFRTYPEAHELAREMQTTLRRHYTFLEEELRQIGSFGTGVSVKSAAVAMTGKLAGLMSKTRTHETSRVIRDNYTALSLMAIACTLLHAFATGVGNKRVADLAISHLKDAARWIIRLSEQAPHAVIREMKEDGILKDEDAGRKTIEETMAAWHTQEVKDAMQGATGSAAA